MVALGALGALGTATLAARLAWEQTVWTWRSGPQMVGFSLAHSFAIVPLALCALLFVIWGAAVLVRATYFLVRHRRFLPLQWLSLAAACLVLVVLTRPYGFWIRLFIERNAAGPHAGAILVDAAARGDLETVAALHDRGVGVNSLGAMGSTALHGAVVEGQEAVVRYLLENGADPTLEADGGASALDVRPNVHDERIQVLLREWSAKHGHSVP